ncbi:hypothetical protein Val02_66200 [Virgisporangium aliadipatigenens]|uniref:HTH luxR-type domain-containing protein n=1 Tax=Virgisporangium aliadipatigenens TaxID=741659 RepID=A0A8J4DTG0_9ACTN|nr:sigma-70 family RNA polymerase sigma factor [Virgisporangium aliadipatigenens]GIJ49734.1 hypothetical protein Val02_66200 [Virgisporangium aliadipatigenens]
MAQDTVSQARPDDSDAEPCADFETFYKKAAPALLRHAASITNSSREKAQEYMQEAMLVVWKHWSELEHRSDGERYRFAQTVMIRVAYRASERAARYKRLLPKLWNRSDEPAVEDGVVANLTADEALAVINSLPGQQRIVMVLMYDGCTAADVGKILGISPSTVRSHLSQARRELRKALDHLQGGGHG